MDIITDTLIPICMPIFSMFIGMFFVRKNPIFLTKSESIDSTISKIKIIEEYNDGFRKSQLINTYFNISLSMYNALSKELHFVELLNLISFIIRINERGIVNYDYKSKLFIRGESRKFLIIFRNTYLYFILMYILTCVFIISILFLYVIIDTYGIIVILNISNLQYLWMIICISIIISFTILIYFACIYKMALNKGERFFTLYIKR